MRLAALRLAALLRLAASLPCALLRKVIDMEEALPIANSWTPLHYASAYNQVCDHGVPALSIWSVFCLGLGWFDTIACCLWRGPHGGCFEIESWGATQPSRTATAARPFTVQQYGTGIDVVRELHKLGCPSWAQGEEGRTAVHVAAEQGWVDLLDVLVEDLDNIVDSRCGL
jgi:ankyrin repeat protein